MFCVKTIASPTPHSEKLVNKISSLKEDLKLEKEKNKLLSQELEMARKEIVRLKALTNAQVEPRQVPPQNLPAIQINGNAQNDE